MATAKQQPIYLTRTHIKSVRDKKNKTGCGRDIVDGVTLVGTAENDERPSCKMCDEHLTYMRRHLASKSFEKSIEGLNLSTKTANKLWKKYAEGGGDLPRYMQGQAWIPENFKWTHETDPSFIPLKSMRTSTALVPAKKDVPVKPSTASVSWIGVAGVEREHEIDVPDYLSMTTRQFERRMDEAASEFRGHHAQAGLQLAAVILPGLEDSKRRFAAGETIDGCKKYEAYIKHLGFTPEQVRQWRCRLNALNKELPKIKRKKTEALPAPEPETVTPVTPEFVPGEWARLNYGDPGTGLWDDEYIGKPMDKWTNTDGRKIEKTQRLAPGQEKRKFTEKRKMIDAYVVRDEYGSIDVVPTIEEAMNTLRPVSTTDEMLAAADEMATKILSGADDAIDTEAVAEDYLAMRRKVAVENADDEEGDEDRRRKPEYEITLRIEASKLSAVERVAKEIFGDALKAVTKIRWGTSRREELLRAKEHVEEAAEIVSDLHNDIENWKESLPENFRGDKEMELEECTSQLESIKDGLDAVSGWDDVEFPGMY